MTDSDIITVEDLPPEIVQAAKSESGNQFRLSTQTINLDKEIDAFERRWVQEALEEAKQAKSEAARLLGVDRNRMNYLCRKHHF